MARKVALTSLILVTAMLWASASPLVSACFPKIGCCDSASCVPSTSSHDDCGTACLTTVAPRALAIQLSLVTLLVPQADVSPTFAPELRPIPRAILPNTPDEHPLVLLIVVTDAVRAPPALA